jgi:hypothetical protein
MPRGDIMKIDTEQLESDLYALIMQSERENADFAQQVFIRKRIREATAQLAQANAYSLDVLIQHVRAINAPPVDQHYFPEEDLGTEQIARQYAPANGSDALRQVVNGSYGGRH